MAEVTLSIGGYSYQVACRDGEESHLERLGKLVDSKAGEARAAVGNASEVRQLLLSALLFADEAIERQGSAPAKAPPSGFDPAILEALAERIEAMAETLEKRATSA